MSVSKLSMVSEASFYEEVGRKQAENKSFGNGLLLMKFVVLLESSLVFVISEYSCVIVSEYFVQSSDVVSIFLCLRELLVFHFTY